jgi:hypothetical protein
MNAAVKRGVAQPGRALPSGGRGRRFESSHPDQNAYRQCLTIRPALIRHSFFDTLAILALRSQGRERGVKRICPYLHGS